MPGYPTKKLLLGGPETLTNAAIAHERREENCVFVLTAYGSRHAATWPPVVCKYPLRSALPTPRLCDMPMSSLLDQSNGEPVKVPRDRGREIQ